MPGEAGYREVDVFFDPLCGLVAGSATGYHVMGEGLEKPAFVSFVEMSIGFSPA